MSVAATVATRPCATAPAAMPPATSIRDMSQPPKTSPEGFVSAGIARVRTASSPLASAGVPFAGAVSVDIACISLDGASLLPGHGFRPRHGEAGWRYVLASSGHIAGIINPPGGKGTYWTNEADPPPPTPEEWHKGAARHDGSWWTDWTAWLAARSGEKGKLPPMGSAAHPPIADAPGTYVLEK